MSKTYFTKYLPIDGEIKEGDYWISRAGQALKLIDADTLLNKKSEKFPEAKTKLDLIKAWGCKKAKLFLCSRDIQVGAEVQKTDSLSKQWDLETENDVKIAKEQGFFKVIGEISPDALSYVKEGDEFDEGDFQIVFRDEEGDMWNSPEASAWTGYTGKYEKVCLMRCPLSPKHFH